MELRFHPGLVVASARVKELISEQQQRNLVRRHLNGHWNPQYRLSNERAIREGGDVLSEFVFSDHNGQPVTVWVLTELDRARTLLMCPEESNYRSSDVEEVREPSFYGSGDPAASREG